MDVQEPVSLTSKFTNATTTQHTQIQFMCEARHARKRNKNEKDHELIILLMFHPRKAFNTTNDIKSSKNSKEFIDLRGTLQYLYLYVLYIGTVERKKMRKR